MSLTPGWGGRGRKGHGVRLEDGVLSQETQAAREHSPKGLEGWYLQEDGGWVRGWAG